MSTPTLNSYPLFKHMSDTYQLTLLESELDEIKQLANAELQTQIGKLQTENALFKSALIRIADASILDDTERARQIAQESLRQ